MMRHSLFSPSTVIAVIAMAATSMLSVDAIAQSSTTYDPSAGNSTPTATAKIDEATIDKFATAYIAVQKVQKEALDSRSGAQPSQAEMQTKMSDAVKSAGMEVEEYNRISQLMLQDKDLQARITAKLQQKGAQRG